MVKLLKINYKNAIRSYWPIFYYGSLMAVFIFYQFLLGYFDYYKLGSWTRANSYGHIIFFAVNYFLAVYSIQAIDDFDLSLPIQDYKIILSKFFMCLIFAGQYILFEIVYIVVKGLSFAYSLAYIFNIVLNLLVITLSIASVAISCGFFLGAIFKNKLAYILVFLPILFFSPFFNKYIFGYGYESMVVPSYLSIFEDNPGAYFQTALGNVYDGKYFIDKIFAFGSSIFFISIGSMAIFKRNIGRKVLMGGLSLVLIILGLNLNLNYDYGYEYSLYPEDQEIREEKLEDYKTGLKLNKVSMDLIIADQVSNKVEIDIENQTGQRIDSIKFYLNKDFEINEIKLDGLDSDYDRNNNDLTIDLGIKDMQRQKLTINYRGRLKEKLNTGDLLYYSSKNSSNLAYSMNWYPLVEIEEPIAYDIRVKNNNKLISNLNDFNVLGPGDNRLEGQAKYIYISTGFYQEGVHNNMVYLGSEEVIKKYLHDYDYVIDRKIEDMGLEKKPEKVIIYPGIYFDVFMIDDFLMVSEPSSI